MTLLQANLLLEQLRDRARTAPDSEVLELRAAVAIMTRLLSTLNGRAHLTTTWDPDGIAIRDWLQSLAP